MHWLIDLQNQYSAAAVALAAALGGVFVWTLLRNLPHLTAIGLVWLGIWIVAMPAGMDAAELVVAQPSMKARLTCARSLSEHYEYWTGHRSLTGAKCEPR
jgi:hypothetical protein